MEEPKKPQPPASAQAQGGDPAPAQAAPQAEQPTAPIEAQLPADQQEPRRRMSAKLAAGIAAAVVAVAVVGGGAFALGGITKGVEQAGESASAASQKVDDLANRHAHTFVKEYGTVHHDAVTRTVHHDAEYRTVTNMHTVCNDCGQVIDGRAAEHIADTGHAGYSTNVPVKEQELVRAAWDETVVDKAAWDEQVVVSEACSGCGVSRESAEAGA